MDSVQRRGAEGGEGSQRVGKVNDLTESIIGAAIRVHRALGPGLIESSYEVCLARELELSGISFERQLSLPIEYQGIKVPNAYRIDLLVDGRVIVELKAVVSVDPIFEQQLLTYLRHTGLEVGLLINFNVKRLTSGVRRVVNNYQEESL